MQRRPHNVVALIVKRIIFRIFLKVNDCHPKIFDDAGRHPYDVTALLPLAMTSYDVTCDWLGKVG